VKLDQSLRVGYIPYLNCAPFFHYLEESGFSETIVSGVPSELNALLQSCALDVSPSSSFEYALNSSDYLLLPGHSISSRGPVESVLLFSPCPLTELQGQRIAITGESATSINLLRILLLEYANFARVEDYVPGEAVETVIANRQPALLIGDRAMKQATDLPEGMRVYDLGSLWYEQTGLPFVFALWILRRDSAQRMPDKISALQAQLSLSVGRALKDLPALAREVGVTNEEGRRLVKYWQTIDYALTDEHLKGLNLFIALCLKHKLLNVSPKIEFFLTHI
jgi:chorismate dehydratase